MKKRTKSAKTKLLLTTIVLVVFGSLVGLGTLTVFTDQDSLDANTFSTGNISLGLNPTTARVTFNSMVPGDTHDRVRHDIIDKGGRITLRVNGRMHHIGLGVALRSARVVVLVHDLEVRVIHAATGELVRKLTIDPTKDYQPLGIPPRPKPHRLPR
jgi:predicted ribosomally synthesized peptide with SipW-like signal peptide